MPGSTPLREVCGAVEEDTGADGSADTVGAASVPRLCLNGVSLMSGSAIFLGALPPV
jgi:hypothetical protein